MFQVLWENRAQLFQKESLPRDPSLDSTVDCIFLVHSVRAPPTPWGRQATVSGPGPEQAHAFPQQRPQASNSTKVFK